jgi:hypothetical protein
MLPVYWRLWMRLLRKKEWKNRENFENCVLLASSWKIPPNFLARLRARDFKKKIMSFFQVVTSIPGHPSPSPACNALHIFYATAMIILWIRENLANLLLFDRHSFKNTLKTLLTRVTGRCKSPVSGWRSIKNLSIMSSKPNLVYEDLDKRCQPVCKDL